jgi:hypothetical protein
LLHSYISKNCLLIKSDTSFPDINAGGTPGPGTVNCPVKYKLPTFLLLVLASGTRFATMYLPFRKHFPCMNYSL